jgi:hypothetical protein
MYKIDWGTLNQQWVLTAHSTKILTASFSLTAQLPNQDVYGHD